MWYNGGRLNDGSRAMPEKPLTYEGILELFRKADRRIKKTERQMKETSRQVKETGRQMKENDQWVKETRQTLAETARLQMKEHDQWVKEIRQTLAETAQLQKETEWWAKEAHRKVSALGSRIGEIVENMVAGNIVEKFQAFDYEIIQCAPRVKYEYKKLGMRGEIDLFLEDGDVAILVEVKTTLETTDVRKHIKQLEEYRRCADARGDKRRFVGAVAGAVVEGEAMEFAHENGMYVIVQSGEAVEIVQTPEGFKAREW